MDTNVTVTQDDYASHLPVLRKVLQTYKTKYAIEHGCGIYSTPVMVQRCEYVLSIDDDYTWAQKTSEAVKEQGKWNFMYGHTLMGDVDFAAARIDLAFIDGVTEYRRESAQAALNAGVPLVICHDWERKGTYKWHRLKIPRGYHVYAFEARHGRRKQTAVITSYPDDLSTWQIEDHVCVLP